MIRALVNLDLWQGQILPHPGRMQGPKSLGEIGLIKHRRPDIAKIYLYVKDTFESKDQLLIKERDKVGIKELKKLKAFIDYLQTIDDVY